jgi:hypothetical protein
VVDRRARRPAAYGINAGSLLADVTIAPEAPRRLNLLRSRAAGLGTPLPARAVRLRERVAKGFSGSTTPRSTRDRAAHGVHPLVPPRGRSREQRSIPGAPGAGADRRGRLLDKTANRADRRSKQFSACFLPVFPIAMLDGARTDADPARAKGHSPHQQDSRRPRLALALAGCGEQVARAADIAAALRSTRAARPSVQSRTTGSRSPDSAAPPPSRR